MTPEQLAKVVVREHLLYAEWDDLCVYEMEETEGWSEEQIEEAYDEARQILEQLVQYV